MLWVKDDSSFQEMQKVLLHSGLRPPQSSSLPKQFGGNMELLERGDCFGFLSHIEKLPAAARCVCSPEMSYHSLSMSLREKADLKCGGLCHSMHSANQGM